MKLSVFVSAVGALAFVGPFAVQPAEAYRRQRPVVVYDELPPTEGRGCYFDRGEEYCGSYCYWEINGKRYCQRRLRDAHSQAGPQHFYQAEPRPYAGEFGMK